MAEHAVLAEAVDVELMKRFGAVHLLDSTTVVLSLASAAQGVQAQTGPIVLLGPSVTPTPSATPTPSTTLFPSRGSSTRRAKLFISAAATTDPP